MTISGGRSIKRIAKERGMHVFGNFLIGFRNDDVVSGIAIDKTPTSTYFWTFVLPVYDENTFLHMSLGERISVGEEGATNLSQAYEVYLQKLAHVKSPCDLVKYIDQRGLSGDYAGWVKYISLIRLGDFSMAKHALGALIGLPISKVLRERIGRMNSALLVGGEAGAQQLLDEWSVVTGRLLGSAPQGGG
ncbi:hypothetical protein [Pseudoxanthomonas sp.]|uniref:hypothetical protein n=1 Tax=Pseudoxanthomonas sp. TaxID=1871049 RepID=UPI0025FC7AD6|nr:hypothetical protein [Pseudoxanthomonas sp.]